MSDIPASRYSDRSTDRYSRSQREEKRTDRTGTDQTTPDHTRPEAPSSPWSGVSPRANSSSSSPSVTREAANG